MTSTLKGNLVNAEKYMLLQYPYHYTVRCTDAPAHIQYSFSTLRFNHAFLWAIKLINLLHAEIKQPGNSVESVEKADPILTSSLKTEYATDFFGLGYK